MRTRRWLLIGIVVGVNVLGELWLCLGIPFQGLAYVLAGMVPAHASLLAFWVAFGGRATPWRLVGALAVVVGLLWLGDRWLAEIWVLLLLQVLPASVLLLLARFFGAELRNDRPGETAPLLLTRFFGAELRSDRPGETAPPLDPQRQWVQFSMWSLLCWTTALALMLSVLRFLPKTTLEELRRLVSDFDNMMITAAILFGNILIALSAMWITLGTRWPLGRYALLASTGAAAACLLLLAVGVRELGGIVVFCCSEVAWMAGSLWLVRLAGYRLVWRRRVRL